MDLRFTVILLMVLFLAGFVSGLSGFAFSAIAAGILWLLPPLVAVPLIMFLSLCNQLLSVARLRGEMRATYNETGESALPFIAGGLVGLPIGLQLLLHLPSSDFVACLGIFLIVYSAFSLFYGEKMKLSKNTRSYGMGWKPAALVGAMGGIVGGFSAFPGSIPVVYCSVLGKTKATTRGVIQPYILSLQAFSLLILATTHPSLFDRDFWLLAVESLPATLLGTILGVEIYQKISDHNFRRAMLILLIASGISLTAKAFTLGA